MFIGNFALNYDKIHNYLISVINKSKYYVTDISKLIICCIHFHY